jgi:hypothetical protein
MNWGRLAVLLVLMGASCILFAFYLKGNFGKGISGLKITVTSQETAGETGMAPGPVDSRNSWIESVELSPRVPVMSDEVDARVKLYKNAPEGIEFRYEWFINTKPVPSYQGSRLPQGAFRKFDRILVRVTPVLNGESGAMFVSPIIVARNSPLELSLSEQVTYDGDSVTLQLLGKDPDGDRVSYSLEEPILEGMTINSETGKIKWTPNKKESGTFKFGAAISGADGAKAVKVFEFRADLK